MIGILQELRYRRINIALLLLELKRDAAPRSIPLLDFWTYLCFHLCNSFNRFSFLFFFSSFALTARSNAFCPYFCPDSARFGASIVGIFGIPHILILTQERGVQKSQGRTYSTVLSLYFPMDHCTLRVSSLLDSSSDGLH